MNRRLEPEIYLSVVPITDTNDQPSVNGKGTVLEWAVKMLQFDSRLQFDRLLEQGHLEKMHIKSLTNRIIEFHDSLARSDPTSGFGDAVSVHAPVRDNYIQASRYSESAIIREKMEQLLHWHDRQFIDCKALLTSRKNNGFVRECHGDLHLANIALYNNRVIIFDCLEFNENLRHIDVINEIAFLLMDLDAHNQKNLANYLINSWLQITSDFESLNLLNYYRAYRSMVRAKVAIIEASQRSGREKAVATERANSYIQLTQEYTCLTRPAIILTHGLSGSGKSTISRKLITSINAIHIRSDIERKRLFKERNTEIYNEDATQMTYRRLGSICRHIISAGYNALVDATFLDSGKRQDFSSLAGELGVPCIILDFTAPRELLEKWLIQRAEKGNDVSDADISVLNQQISNQDPLTKFEKSISINIDTSQTIDIQALAIQILEKINKLK